MINKTHELTPPLHTGAGLIINALKSFVEDIPSLHPAKEEWIKEDETLNACSRNKLSPIMYKILKDTQLEKSYKKSAAESLLYEYEIKRIFNQFNAMGIKAILLRGLYLGFKIYEDPALRPFIDIDILIEKHTIEKAKKALKDLGYYYSPFLFSEEFFLDVHLHLVYFHPKHRIPCEIHWAIDHPFTTYDIKMEEVFETATPVNIEGIECYDIQPELRLIFLLIHIQKHLPYLKYLYNGPNLLQQIIKDGELLHIFDAYLFLKRYNGNFNWSIFIEKAIRWNVDGVMYSTLKTVERIFNPPIPEYIFTSLVPPAQRSLEKILIRNVLRVAGSDKTIPKATRKLIFTPKRLPDLYTWFFPDKNTIIREYFSRTFPQGISNSTQKTAEYSKKAREKPFPNGLILWYYIANFVKCMGTILHLSIKYLKPRSIKRAHSSVG